MHRWIQHLKANRSSSFPFPSGNIRDRNYAPQAGTSLAVDPNANTSENRRREPLPAGGRTLRRPMQPSQTKGLNFHSFQLDGMQRRKVAPLTWTSSDSKPIPGSNSNKRKRRHTGPTTKGPASTDPALQEEEFEHLSFPIGHHRGKKPRSTGRHLLPH